MEPEITNRKLDEGSTRTRVHRNHHLEQLRDKFLFQEISKRERAHIKACPSAKLIDLGQGNTTQPIPESVTKAMAQYALGLSTIEGYHGYEAEEGRMDLREAICTARYDHTSITSDEIFISDGSQSDVSRLQMLLGHDVTIAVQDPSYPIYADLSVMSGHAGSFKETTSNYKKIVYLACTPENNFFPDLSKTPRTDFIFFCNPNNPTGATASRQELEQLVKFAKVNGSIIIFDTAYAAYISDESPRSIYEIPGATEVAIEVSTFSKFAGFTGVRLGWTVVPHQLSYADGYSVIEDFHHIIWSSFCGASNIVQQGGIACLTPDGYKALQSTITYYLENARILVETFTSVGLKVYGGVHVPFVWVHFPGSHSWDVFEEILEKTHIGTTPGIGFGSNGEEYIRICSFASREIICEASTRFKQHFEAKADLSTT